ncbi:MAG: MarR family transcriptional regulator [Marinobacterium sp.]|nr:MarR family transcriptional regulator [Marinobacterium sp.]
MRKEQQSHPQQSDQQQPSQQLVLEDFFPYRLSVLAQDVSESVAEIYTGRFQLRRAEWRVVAALGQHQPMSAKAITAHTCMDKMPVSRAITVLRDRGLVEQSVDSRDRRYSQLHLTEQGMELYREIVPWVLAREQALLDSLDENEQAVLENLFKKLHRKVDELKQQFEQNSPE